jgi:hypothetical protein
MKQFKIRCSALGTLLAGDIGASESQLKFMKEMDERDKVMTKIQSEKYGKALFAKNHPELPTGVKTYVQNWLKEQLYGQRIEFSNKYTKKGWDVEDDSINYLGDYEKNEEYFENDYMCGTPDIITDDMIRDVKNSWDYSTFPLFETKLPNKDYFYQLQGYMVLTGKTKGSVDYMLMDTPEDDSLTYNHLGRPLRIKSFAVERDNDFMFEVARRVGLCREYIDRILSTDMLEAMAPLPEMTAFGEEVVEI